MKKSDFPKCAIILAAGMGIRIRNTIGEYPKGLITFNGVGLIERTIIKLIENDFSDLYVVTGYKNELLVKSIISIADEHLNLNFVHNKKYSHTGSMESLYLLNNYIKNDFILFESDIIYENKALNYLLNFGIKDTILASDKTFTKDEVWIYGKKNSESNQDGFEQGRIEHINKESFNKSKVQGELVGISWISSKLFLQMCDYYFENRNSTLKYHYEEILSDLSKNHVINYLKINNLIWAEIDTREHYIYVLNSIYPKLKFIEE